jgi:hypothetical protein
MSIATPSLRIDLVNGPRILDSRASFTRASTGRFHDAVGSFRSAPSNMPRWSWNPATGVAEGVLFEAQRTNLALRSEAFDDAAWSKTSLAVTANSAVAPDGTSTADKLAATAPGGAVSQAVTITAGNAITASVHARAISSHIMLSVTDGANAAACWFNLAAGTVGTSMAGTATVLFSSAQIVPVGGGWYRCAITVTTSSATSFAISVVPASADLTGSIPGDSIHAWGAQIEAPGSTSAPSSYIATATTAVTRNGDALVIPTDSRWFNAAEGTLLLEWTNRLVTRANVVLGGIGDTFDNSIYMVRPNSGQMQCVMRSAAATSLNSAKAYGFAEGTVGRAAMAYKASDFAFVLDGGVPSTGTSGDVPVNLVRLALGGHPYGPTSGSQADMPLRRLAYFPRRLSNAHLQTLTAP